MYETTSTTTNLWMPFDASGLLTNTRLVRLRSDDFEKIKRIVDSSRRIAFHFFRGCTLRLLRFLPKAPARGDRTGPCRCGSLCSLLCAGFGRSLDLGWRSGLLFCKQTRVLCLARHFLTPLCLSLLLCFV